MTFVTKLRNLIAFLNNLIFQFATNSLSENNRGLAKAGGKQMIVLFRLNQ
jgi:hypothetical protein